MSASMRDASVMNKLRSLLSGSHNPDACEERDATPDSGSWTLTLLPDKDIGGSLHKGGARPTGGETQVPALPLLRINDVFQLLRISTPTLWRMRLNHVFPGPSNVSTRAVGVTGLCLEAHDLAISK